MKRGPKIKLSATFQGETKPLKEWARDLGVDYNTIYNRLVVMRWTPERAFAGTP